MDKERLEERRAFQQQVARGRAVAEAREKGLEMIDVERLADMLTDLARMGYIKVNDNRGDTLKAAEEGMKVLRG